jgi:hypothetical protein
MALTDIRVQWPADRQFAFTIFDDPDGQPYQTTRLVYSFLERLGFRTTIAVWPMEATRDRNSGGETCANPEYRCFLMDLQQRGFEIGFHNAAPQDSTREETIQALEVFERYFGAPPFAMANHYNREAIYWGSERLTSWRRTAYNLITRCRNDRKFFGHVEGDPAFWGDICRERISYCRNFVFSGINTLRACPWMPYSDPLRPYVRNWFSATEGDMAPSFLKAVAARNQDQLEAEGGASILYTHFGHGFVENGQLHPEFCRLMERLACKNGWFVPVSTLLDFLMKTRGETVLNERQRNRLETRWLWEKLFRGTS